MYSCEVLNSKQNATEFQAELFIFSYNHITLVFGHIQLQSHYITLVFSHILETISRSCVSRCKWVTSITEIILESDYYTPLTN